eukprot:6461024-Amphidinium_carterae.1
MKQENCLRPLELAQCTSRQQELLQVKRDPQIVKVGTNKQLITDDAQPQLEADLSSSLRVREAMQRRALVFDQWDVCTFECMERWHAYLFDLLGLPAVPGCQAITLQQVLDADRRLFTVAGAGLMTGLQRQANGSLPLETAFEGAKLDPIVTALLRPLPR